MKSNYKVSLFDKICSGKIAPSPSWSKYINHSGKKYNAAFAKIFASSPKDIHVFVVDEVANWLLDFDKDTPNEQVLCFPPFKKTWLEFRLSTKNDVGVLVESVTSSSLLHPLIQEQGKVFELKEDESLLQVSLFIILKTQRWICYNQSYVVYETQTGKFRANYARPFFLQVIDSYNENPEKGSEKIEDDCSIGLAVTLKVLDLLNTTRTIGTKSHVPKPEFAKAFAQRNEGHALTIFKTLTIKTRAGEFPFHELVKPKQVSKSVSVTGKNPLRQIRGSLRRYTEEKKLFGKFVGVFWVEDYEKGKAEDGVILKNYVVK